jgi:hypothetical protein
VRLGLFSMMNRRERLLEKETSPLTAPETLAAEQAAA